MESICKRTRRHCYSINLQKIGLSFSAYEENDVYVGLVKYIDHEKDLIPWQNAFEPFVHKDVCFEHEKELRVLLVKKIKGMKKFSLPQLIPQVS